MSDDKGSEIRNPGTEEAAGTNSPPAGESAGPAASKSPGWKGWAISIIAAVILSVAATLLLGGWSSLRPLHAAGGGPSSGCGGSCCSVQVPADGSK
jgi:hypothetical protein